MKTSALSALLRQDQIQPSCLPCLRSHVLMFDNLNLGGRVRFIQCNFRHIPSQGLLATDRIMYVSTPQDDDVGQLRSIGSVLRMCSPQNGITKIREDRYIYIALRQAQHWSTSIASRSVSRIMLLNRFVPRATGSLLRSTQSARSVLLRTMSTAGKKKEFLCIMPDRPNVLELRKKVKG
jgi:hypothetical protein